MSVLSNHKVTIVNNLFLCFRCKRKTTEEPGEEVRHLFPGLVLNCVSFKEYKTQFLQTIPIFK